MRSSTRSSMPVARSARSREPAPHRQDARSVSEQAGARGRDGVQGVDQLMTRVGPIGRLGRYTATPLVIGGVLALGFLLLLIALQAPLLAASMRR